MQRILYLILLLVVSVGIFAQRNQIILGESSIDITVGPSTLFLGDVGDPFKETYFYTLSDFGQKLTANSTVSIGFHQSISDRLAYKFAIHNGVFDRADNNFKFRASVFELTGRLEYNLFSTYYPKVKSLYLFAGFGVLYSSWVNDRIVAPIATNIGNAVSPVVPVGIGYKHELFDRLCVGAELNVHYSFTDLLEGKAGGMPHDALSSLALVVSYQISDANRRLKGCNCSNW